MSRITKLLEERARLTYWRNKIVANKQDSYALNPLIIKFNDELAACQTAIEGLLVADPSLFKEFWLWLEYSLPSCNFEPTRNKCNK